MRLFLIYGRDDGHGGDVFKSYLVAAPDEAEARTVVPDSFEIMSVEATNTGDAKPRTLFVADGQIELIDW